MKIFFFYTLMVFTVIGLPIDCKNKNYEDPVKPFNTGKNRFTIMVGGDTREYFVHVPAGYKATIPFPVVFMLHGSGGNGEKFYNISGWKEVGEKENILTVFPSSFQYPCVFDDGIQKPNAEKWNSFDLELCSGGAPKDDVKFLSQVIDELKQKFTVDNKLIFVVGFSNGGEMASRTAIELSDKIAAVVACAGALPVDTNFVPLRKLPILLQAGNADDKLMAKLNTTISLPMNFDELFINFPVVQQVADVFINAFALDSNYTTGGDTNTFLYADYKGIAAKENTFRFMLVKGLGHNYPNGINHQMKGAEVHWEWLKNYSLL